VLNCDDYSVEKAIPLNARAGVPAYWTWNWQRNKYYFVLHKPESLAVFDPVCDSITRWLPTYGSRSPCYVSAHDCVYVVDDTQMRVIDCASDSFIRDVPSAPYHPWGAVSWDSVGDKVYAWACDAPSEDMLLAYSCVNDSLVAAVSTGILSPTVLAYYPPLHKAYLGSDWRTDNVASYDCEGDSVVRVFPVRYAGPGFVRDSYNSARGKLYVPSRGSTDTLCAIDCATDSIVSRTALPAGVSDIEMAHRTDRLFLTVGMTRVMVLDCGADTLLGPGIETGWGPGFLAYDSVHNRVFVSCEDSSIYVLSDDTAGVAEQRTASPLKWDITVSPNPVTDIATIRWHVPKEAEASLGVYNTAGLLVAVLTDGRFKPGSHTSIWNGKDSRGRLVPRGVYFYRLDTPGFRAVKKAVVTR